jgi:hypothetical protein
VREREWDRERERERERGRGAEREREEEDGGSSRHVKVWRKLFFPEILRLMRNFETKNDSN